MSKSCRDRYSQRSSLNVAARSLDLLVRAKCRHGRQLFRRAQMFATGVLLVLSLSSSLPAALVGYFPFEGNTDETYFGNNGIPMNAPTFETGQFGQAMRLDSSLSQHVIIPDGGGTEIGAGDYSIAFWVNSTETADVWYLQMGTSGPPGQGLRPIDSCTPCGLDPGQVAFQMDAGGAAPFLTADAMHDGNWHHWAFVRDANNLELLLYRDGVEVGFSGDEEGDASSPGEIGVIGAQMNGDQSVTQGFFNGLMDELAFYDHALLPTEVTTIMNSGVTVPPVPAPAVSTLPSTDIAFESATLNGNLTAGLAADVSIYWGETNGLMEPNDWDNVIDAGLLPQGPFSEALGSLQDGTSYFYRAFAENSAGTAWAATSESFATLAFPTSATWVTDGVGLWSNDDNWTGIAPNSNSTTAILAGAITSNTTVAVEADVTVNGVQFNNANTYVVGGSGSVTLAVNTGSANIDVNQGDHQFQVVVNLASDTDADVSGGASLAFNEELNLQGNTLTKTGTGDMQINNELNTGGGSVVGNLGTISGSGSINGDLVNVSATVAPGNSPGVLTVRGNYDQQSAATLAIELGDTAADLLDVEGAISLAGSLEVSLFDGFSPVAGDEFDILDFASISGSFDEVFLPPLSSGLVWDDSALYSDGSLTVQVPEPTSILLFGLGALALLVRNDFGSRIRKNLDFVLSRPKSHDFGYVAEPEPLGTQSHSRYCLLAMILLLTLTMSSHVSAALVGFFPFDGNTSELVGGNNGIPMNGPTFTTGQFGMALNLDGIDDYVVIPDGGGTEVGAGDYTIAHWLKSTDNDGTILKTGTGGGPGAGIRALDSGNFGAFCSDGNGVYQLDNNVDGPYLALADPAAAVDGTWHHYAFVRNAANQEVSLYLDGALAIVGTGCGGQATNPMSFPADDVTSPGEVSHIGVDVNGDQTPAANFLEGMMDELAFYDHALSQAEVADIFQNGVTVVLPTASSWNVDSFGEWTEPSNWTFFAPNANDQTAVFGSKINSDRTVTVDTPITVKEVEFDNVNSYFIAGSESVTLQADTGNASVNVLQGAHKFQAAVNLSSNTDVDVAAGATLVFNNQLNFASNTITKTGGGEMQVNNNLAATAGTVQVTAGTVSGVGTVSGDLDNPSGNVAPGKSPGILTVDGNFTQGSGGALSIELGGLLAGEEHDRLVVTGSINMQGELDVSLIGGFTPVGGEMFDILDFPAGMATINLDTPPDNGVLPSGLTWDLSMLDLTGELGIVGGFPDGDYDASNLVGLADLNLVLFNWSKMGSELPVAWSHQRPGNNDVVGLAQLNGVLFNWNQSGVVAAAVPEPGTLTLLALALLTAGRTIARRRIAVDYFRS